MAVRKCKDTAGVGNLYDFRFIMFLVQAKILLGVLSGLARAAPEIVFILSTICIAVLLLFHQGVFVVLPEDVRAWPCRIQYLNRLRLLSLVHALALALGVAVYVFVERPWKTYGWLVIPIGITMIVSLAVMLTKRWRRG